MKRRKCLLNTALTNAGMTAYPASLLPRDSLLSTENYAKNRVFELIADWVGYPEYGNRFENLGSFTDPKDALTFMKKDLMNGESGKYCLQTYELYEFPSNPNHGKADCRSVTDFAFY